MLRKLHFVYFQYNFHYILQEWQRTPWKGATEVGSLLRDKMKRKLDGTSHNAVSSDTFAVVSSSLMREKKICLGLMWENFYNTCWNYYKIMNLSTAFLSLIVMQATREPRTAVIMKLRHLTIQSEYKWDSRTLRSCLQKIQKPDVVQIR